MTSKETIEKKHVESFLTKFGVSTKGILKQQDPPEPDFCFKNSESPIGIEHTRLIHQKDQRNVDPKAHSELGYRILKKAEDIFKQTSNLKLHVDVDFRSDYGLVRGKKPTYLAGSDIDDLSKFIAEFVVQNIPVPESTVIFDAFDWETRKIRFPDKIDKIIIWNTDHLKASCWTPGEGGLIPPIYSNAAFINRYKEKNSKPINYLKSYDQIWLLMVENHIEFTSSFDFEYQDIPEIDSPFNRIFIYRFGYSEIIEINNSRSDNDRWPNKKA